MTTAIGWVRVRVGARARERVRVRVRARVWERVDHLGVVRYIAARARGLAADGYGEEVDVRGKLPKLGAGGAKHG